MTAVGVGAHLCVRHNSAHSLSFLFHSVPSKVHEGHRTILCGSISHLEGGQIGSLRGVKGPQRDGVYSLWDLERPGTNSWAGRELSTGDPFSCQALPVSLGPQPSQSILTLPALCPHPLPDFRSPHPFPPSHRSCQVNLMRKPACLGPARNHSDPPHTHQAPTLLQPPETRDKCLAMGAGGPQALESCL